MSADAEAGDAETGMGGSAGFAGECSPGASRCQDDVPQKCTASGQWESEAVCEHSCSDGKCNCAGVDQAWCAGGCVDTSADTHNCGACDRDCAGLNCAGGECEAQLVATGLPPASMLKVIGSTLFVVTVGSVFRVPVGGGATSPPAVAWGPTIGATAAADDKRVYWADGLDVWATDEVLINPVEVVSFADSVSSMPWLWLGVVGLAVGDSDAYCFIGNSMGGMTDADLGKFDKNTGSHTTPGLTVGAIDGWLDAVRGFTVSDVYYLLVRGSEKSTGPYWRVFRMAMAVSEPVLDWTVRDDDPRWNGMRPAQMAMGDTALYFPERMSDATWRVDRLNATDLSEEGPLFEGAIDPTDSSPSLHLDGSSLFFGRTVLYRGTLDGASWTRLHQVPAEQRAIAAMTTDGAWVYLAYDTGDVVRIPK